MSKKVSMGIKKPKHSKIIDTRAIHRQEGQWETRDQLLLVTGMEGSQRSQEGVQGGEEEAGVGSMVVLHPRA